MLAALYWTPVNQFRINVASRPVEPVKNVFNGQAAIRLYRSPHGNWRKVPFTWKLYTKCVASTISAICKLFSPESRPDSRDVTNCVKTNKSWLGGPKVWGEIRIAFLFDQKWVKLDNFQPFHKFTNKPSSISFIIFYQMSFMFMLSNRPCCREVKIPNRLAGCIFCCLFRHKPFFVVCLGIK